MSETKETKQTGEKEPQLEPDSGGKPEEPVDKAGSPDAAAQDGEETFINAGAI
jgi:hypothetical protein